MITGAFFYSSRQKKEDINEVNKEKKVINKNTTIGIDTLEIEVETKLQKKFTSNQIFSTRTSAKIGEIKSSVGNKTGFRISLNIPKMIRTDNVKPFGIVDKIHLEEIVNDVTQILSEQFSIDLKHAFVSVVEINATAELENPKNIGCIMNLLALMFLQGKGKVFLTAHGKQNRYKNVPLSSDVLRNTYQIESLRTPRLGNKCFCWKFYNKSLEENIEDKGLLRLEQIHNSRSLEREEIPRQLDLFLSSENIVKLVYLYQKCFKRYFLDIYWQHGEQSFTDKCVNTVILELQEETPLSTAKILRELISIDFEIFEKACRLFYSNPKTATQAIRRVRNSGKVEINHGAIRELVLIFRAILYSK